jgi:methanesulfonate monooxygenase small subunit
MIWLEKDRAGLGDLFKLLPAHNRDRRPITRHFSVFDVDFADDQRSASVVSGVQVFRTESDGGVTSLAAVGKYMDEISLEGEAPILLSRELRLETRMLGMGFHEPL